MSSLFMFAIQRVNENILFPNGFSSAQLAKCTAQHQKCNRNVSNNHQHTIANQRHAAQRMINGAKNTSPPIFSDMSLSDTVPCFQAKRRGIIHQDPWLVTKSSQRAACMAP
jgi:hypothetical protein